MNILDTFSAQWRRRSWWLNLLLLFCLYMALAYMPWDIFVKPVAVDEEVWFGVTLHGWPAKLTAPLHWLIYGAGAYGLWHMKSWLWPWAAVYVAQISVAMLVWNLLDPRGAGLVAGLIAAALFAVPAVALWRARDQFGEDR